MVYVSGQCVARCVAGSPPRPARNGSNTAGSTGRGVDDVLERTANVASVVRFPLQPQIHVAEAAACCQASVDGTLHFRCRVVAGFIFGQSPRSANRSCLPGLLAGEARRTHNRVTAASLTQKLMFVGSETSESYRYRISYLGQTVRKGFWATTEAGP